MFIFHCLIVGGSDSPPEPAPSDIPMRMNGGMRPLKPYGMVSEMDHHPDSEHTGYHIPTGAGLYIPGAGKNIIILIRQ
jgi:hypothetical protein